MINAHDVRCPLCHVPRSKTCRYPDGTSIEPEISHSLRLLYAAKAQEIAKTEAKTEETFLGGWVVLAEGAP